MSCAGSGSIFESIVNNEKVKKAIAGSKYTQIVDIMNPTSRIFDPEMIGYAATNDLKVAVRAFKPAADKDTSALRFPVIRNGRMGFVAQSTMTGKGLNGVCTGGPVASPLIESETLLNMCPDQDKLNKLYERQFSKIYVFDEEEDQMTMPEKENGYIFKLDLDRVFNYIQDGEEIFEQDLTKSKVVPPLSDAELAKMIGIFTVTDSMRDEENTFKVVELDETVPGGCTYEQRKLETLFEWAKVCFKNQSSQLITGNDEFKDKFVELNWLKSLGGKENSDEAYVEILNNWKASDHKKGNGKEIYLD